MNDGPIPARHGWFKVWRVDRDRIIEQCEGSSPAVLSVWDAFCDLANEHNSNVFTVSVGVIRTRAGLGRTATFQAIELLEELGMVSHESNADPANKKRLLPSTYTLLTPSAKQTTSPSNKRTTPSPGKLAARPNSGLKTSVLKDRQDVIKEEPAATGGDERGNAHPPNAGSSIPGVQRKF